MGNAVVFVDRAALLTGRYPMRTGVGSAMEYATGEGGGLSHDEVTLPEMLARSPGGWNTSLVGKWHVANLDDPATLTDPGEQGFAWYASSDNLWDYFSWDKSLNGTLTPVTTYATTDTANDAIARIAAMSEPWFLQLAFHAPHAPYQTPPAELVTGPTPTTESVYGAMLTAADVELGRVLASMDPDQRSHTTILVLGDNGSPSIVEIDLPGRLKGSVYQGGVHVPFVVAGPRVTAPGSETDALVSVVDVFPTLAEIAAVTPVVGDPPIDGVSFLPVLADGSEAATQLLARGAIAARSSSVRRPRESIEQTGRRSRLTRRTRSRRTLRRRP